MLGQIQLSSAATLLLFYGIAHLLATGAVVRDFARSSLDSSGGVPMKRVVAIVCLILIGMCCFREWE